ncbi:hypothetical protein A2U01_0033748, partial [Trifolium medium]|nr:hypothetical protein [Trifolium medium]
MNPKSFFKVTDGLSKENCIAVHLFTPYEHERLPVIVSPSVRMVYLGSFLHFTAKRLSVRILDSIVTPPKFLQTERAFDMMNYNCSIRSQTLGEFCFL